jgi:hypothetical protein
MKHIKLFENLEDLVYGEVQSLIDNNQFLKGKVEATKDTVFEAGDYILLLGDLSHITDAHVDETVPGSKFNKGVDLKKAIIELVSNNKPTEMTKGFGTSETKVTDSKEAEKFKWLGLDSKNKVGQENVHKLDPNSDEFKSMNIYTYKDSRGNEFSIKVKEGAGEETTFLSFIGAKIGDIGNKPVLSVMTAFPGKNGSEVANRNDFMKSGYYFTTTSKQVIESSHGQVSESKVLKFDDFNETMQYAVLKNSKDLHDKEIERRKEKAENKTETKPVDSDKTQFSEGDKDMDVEESEPDMDVEESEPEMQSQEESETERHESLRIKLFGR